MATHRPPFELADLSGRRCAELKNRKRSRCTDQTVDTRTMVQSLITLEDKMKQQCQDVDLLCLNSSLMTSNSFDSEDDAGDQRDENTLFESVVTKTEMLISVVEEIEGLEKDNADMKCELKEISEECEKIGEVVVQRKMGQFASQIERAIVDKVLNGLIDSDEYVATISDMEKAIKGKPYYGEVFKTEQNRECAEKIWRKLKQELHLTGRHLRYIQRLKEYYLPMTCASAVIDPVKVLQFKKSLAKGTSIVEDEELFMELVHIYEQCK